MNFAGKTMQKLSLYHLVSDLENGDPTYTSPVGGKYNHVHTRINGISLNSRAPKSPAAGFLDSTTRYLAWKIVNSLPEYSLASSGILALLEREFVLYSLHLIISM